MKKKLIAFSLMVILMFSIIAPGLAACQHSYAWVTTKSATCQQAGTKAYKCTKCGSVQKTQPIPRLPCSGVWKTVRAACHPDGGLEQQVCTMCNRVMSTRTLPKKAHTMSAWRNDPDPNYCTSWTRECTVCHAYEESDVTLHDYSHGYCTKCGKPED